MYKVVQIWPGQTVTYLHTISPGHIWTTLYIHYTVVSRLIIFMYYIYYKYSWKDKCSDKRCRENQNTHFMFSNFVSENRAVYENVKNLVQLDRSQMTTQYGAEYLILIIFPRRQWSRERISMLSYTYIARLVNTRLRIRVEYRQPTNRRR
jgi:hypothetical protein